MPVLLNGHARYLTAGCCWLCGGHYLLAFKNFYYAQ